MRTSNPAFRQAFTPTVAAGPALTLDDVVMHTLGLFTLLVATAAGGWFTVPAAAGAVMAAGLSAFALSLVIAFTKVTRPALIIAFTALQGFAVGGISRIYEHTYDGIVLQALLGTAVVFVAMLLAYRARLIRATAKLRAVVVGTLLGVVALSLIDLALRVTTGSRLPVLNDPTPLGIAVSVVILIAASLQFILDFDFIEKAVAARASRREAWRCGYGLVVGFVWVYLEMLRLLGKIRQ